MASSSLRVEPAVLHIQINKDPSLKKAPLSTFFMIAHVLESQILCVDWSRWLLDFIVAVSAPELVMAVAAQASVLTLNCDSFIILHTMARAFQMRYACLL